MTTHNVGRDAQDGVGLTIARTNDMTTYECPLLGMPR